MRLNDDLRFPYPVLSQTTGDYVAGQITFTAKIDEKPASGALSLEYSFTLEQDSIRELVVTHSASAGLFVTCLDTFYSALHDLAATTGRLDFPAGLLHGTVLFRPVVVSKAPIYRYRDESLHAEFGPDPIDFPAGALLACGEELRINVGMDKLASMDSIFLLANNPALSAGMMEIGFDGQKIAINVSPDVFETIHLLRPKYGKNIVLNSVYLPAIMEVISELKQDTGTHEGKRWHRIFTAKCQHQGINLENSDPLTTAELILKQPLGRLASLREELD